MREQKSELKLHWGCHLTHKRFNVGDGVPVSPTTVLENEQIMSCDYFLNEFLSTLISGDTEREHLEEYMKSRGIPFPDHVTLYTISFRQAMRFCSRVHFEEWFVVKIHDMLFPVGQPSDVL